MKIHTIVLGPLAMAVLTNCAAAPLAMSAGMMAAPAIASSNNKVSDVTNKYSNAQIERCARSLTTKDQIRAQEAMKRRAMIPIVGVFGTEKAYYAEAEKICKEKGILPR